MFLESIVAANIVRPWLKYLAVAIAVLAAVWAWNRWLDGRDEAAFERGQIAGRAEVQGRWDTERGQQLEDQAKRERQYRDTETALRTEIDKNRKASDEVIRTISADRARALEQLRNRPERPPSVAGGAVPADPSPDGPAATGCTGSGLWRPDAAFLVGEAARALELKEHLRACYAHVDKLELELNGPIPGR